MEHATMAGAWALSRAHAYGTAEGYTAGQTWSVRYEGGAATASDLPRPNKSAKVWNVDGYATMPRGVLLSCIRADAVTRRERSELDAVTEEALADAFDRAFRAAVEAWVSRCIAV